MTCHGKNGRRKKQRNKQADKAKSVIRETPKKSDGEKKKDKQKKKV